MIVDFLRVLNSKRLNRLIYSHNKAKIHNKDAENSVVEDNNEENKIENNEMENDGRKKIEHDACDGQVYDEKMKKEERYITNAKY